MDDIFFSIIIPTYNRAAFISKAIESVLTQTYGNFEIIIVDDGSTDNTAEKVKPYLSEKVHYVKIENSERAAARNTGMRQAKGDYVTFLDSDDIYYNNYLFNAEKTLKKYNYPEFFHQAYEAWSEAENKSINQFAVRNNDVYSLIKGNHLSCIGVFLKSEVAQQYRFNEDRNLAGSEDWELWLRIAARFGIKTDNKVSSALIIHDSRSVLTYDENKLLNRKNLALKYSFEDVNVQRVYGKYRKAMEAYCDTYIALHLALSGKSLKALRYLIISIYYLPEVLIKKRTFAIIKYILLNMIGLRKYS